MEHGLIYFRWYFLGITLAFCTCYYFPFFKEKLRAGTTVSKFKQKKLTLQCVTRFSCDGQAPMKLERQFDNEAMTPCSKPKSGLYNIKIKSINVISPIFPKFLKFKIQNTCQQCHDVQSGSSSLYLDTPNASFINSDVITGQNFTE